MKSLTSKKRAGWLVVIFLLCFIILFFAFFSRKMEIYLNNGGDLFVKSPSLLNSLRGAECKIVYRPDETRSGTINLWRDLVDQPVLLMPISKGKSLFCLYNYDTNFRLMCIDPESKYISFPTNNWSCLNGAVCSTPWAIREANLTEWIQALNQLKEMSLSEFKRCRVPIYDFGIVRCGFGYRDISDTMEGQIKQMQQAGSDQWPIIESRR